MPAKVFIRYSHQDESCKDALEKHRCVPGDRRESGSTGASRPVRTG